MEKMYAKTYICCDIEMTYHIAGNFRMVQIFVFFECTFRMQKIEHAKIYITRGLSTRASDHISV